MKIEIDTKNKTIKVLDESTWQEVFDIVVELPYFDEYRFIPNTIINTIKITDSKPLEWIQPFKPWTNPYNPYTITCSNLNNNAKAAISNSIHLQKSQIEL